MDEQVTVYIVTARTAYGPTDILEVFDNESAAISCRNKHMDKHLKEWYGDNSVSFDIIERELQ